MIKLGELEKLIQATLFTGYIEGEKPVSLLIIADPESGKTELVKKAQRTKGVLYLTDTTAWGIVDKHWDEIESRKIRHIIIPDLTVPLGKQSETRKTFTRFLSALIEEGVVELQSYAVTKTAKTAQGLRCGLISTITPAALDDQRAGWRKFGFMTRMLPVSYSYSQTTVDEIFESILKHQYRQEQPYAITLPDHDIPVELPPRIAEEANILVRFLAQNEGTYGFRYQKEIQTLTMGSALFNGRDIVTKDDYEFLSRLTFFYLNTACKPI